MTTLEEIKNKYHIPVPANKYQAVIDEHKIYKRCYRALEIYKKQDGKCFYCEGQMKLHKNHKYKPEYMTIDHYVPKCRGGTREGDNAIGACLKCNNKKSAFD